MLGEANREMAERQGRPDDGGYQSNIGSHGLSPGRPERRSEQRWPEQRRSEQWWPERQPGPARRGQPAPRPSAARRRTTAGPAARWRTPAPRRSARSPGPRWSARVQPGSRQPTPATIRDRDNQARDNQGRDSQRDNQPREQRLAVRAAPGRARRQRQDPRPDLSEENAPQFLQQPSLPEVMPATEDDGGAAVRTPEAEAPAKPARTRVSRPRAPRAVSEDGTPAPTRSRRKPVAEAERPAPVRPEGDQD